MEGISMKTINVKVPERLATEVGNYVKEGWFSDEEEVVRAALQEFIRTHRLKLMEQFMQEDIAWALKFKKA